MEKVKKKKKKWIHSKEMRILSSSNPQHLYIKHKKKKKNDRVIDFHTTHRHPHKNNNKQIKLIYNNFKNLL